MEVEATRSSWRLAINGDWYTHTLVARYEGVEYILENVRPWWKVVNVVRKMRDVLNLGANKILGERSPRASHQLMGEHEFRVNLDGVLAAILLNMESIQEITYDTKVPWTCRLPA